jgi:hypothetical protein
MQKAKDIVVDVTAGFLSDAEKELAAFARTVQELFGSGQVRQSIEDWIEELESMDWRCAESVPDWRGITIGAAARLASRISALSQTRGRKNPQTIPAAACQN